MNATSEPFRLGMTSATARGQYPLLEEWRLYLQQKLNHPVTFVFRRSYLECMDLMEQNKLDFAWISSPAYFENVRLSNLLVTPLYHGKPFDLSYLIVPASDHDTASLLNLKDKVFAFVDPDSSTGYIETNYQLLLNNKNPENFFKKTFFTFDDQKIVAAVAIGLADAGSISGFAWDTLAQSRPDITSQTRIVLQSAVHGLSPIVARATLDRHDTLAMQRVLLNMSKDAEGIKLLTRLNIDGFAPADWKLYHNDYLMMQRTGHL
ncbi:MAG: PhnD/SsuA/transferrin family substrate-binding protein [Proteobacteria bacterium]|nr:PhnD/SsuA/transferrin family substrate-binding protein [Pseudomonadota bacterium]